jgi:acetyl esterase/lipase
MKGCVDTELLPLVSLLPSIDFAHYSLAEIRANIDLGALDPSMDNAFPVTVETATTPGTSGSPDIKMVIYQPVEQADARPAILHIHGGGYVLGSPQIMDAANRQLSAELDCVIVSVAYRLAPENVFPAAIDDCYAALTWLFKNADSLGVDATRVGVKGESAGGGLAAAVALMARDRGEFALACQSLMAPMLDDRTCIRADLSPCLGELIWTSDSNRFGWTAMLGQTPGNDSVSPYAAPARAADLSGLPATFIAIGSLDLFLDENLDYAKRLAAAGVPVELQVFPGAFHGFDMILGIAIAERARQASQESLRKALFPT